MTVEPLLLTDLPNDMLRVIFDLPTLFPARLVQLMDLRLTCRLFATVLAGLPCLGHIPTSRLGHIYTPPTTTSWTRYLRLLEQVARDLDFIDTRFTDTRWLREPLDDCVSHVRNSELTRVFALYVAAIDARRRDVFDGLRRVVPLGKRPTELRARLFVLTIYADLPWLVAGPAGTNRIPCIYIRMFFCSVYNDTPNAPSACARAFLEVCLAETLCPNTARRRLERLHLIIGNMATPANQALLDTHARRLATLCDKRKRGDVVDSDQEGPIAKRTRYR
jgi:hypothetical protein